MKNSQRLVHRLVIWIVVAIPFVVPPCVYAQVNNSATNTANEQQGIATVASVEDLRTLESQTTEAIEKVLPAMVAVGNRFGRNPDNVIWEGGRFASGVIIREDGLILSQYHVSHEGAVGFETGLKTYGKPGDKVDVILQDGRRMEAELLGGERLADISLLRLTEPGKYPFVTFAQDDSVALGDWVIKLGHPLGYQPARGVVARLGRVLYLNPVNLVTDCITSGGDSGGPIINLDGKIVGVVQNSYMPQHIFELASRRSTAMAYMTSRKIRGKMGSMLAGIVPHETSFEDHDERTRMYEQSLKALGMTDRRDGKIVLGSWRSVAAENKSSVVEVLGKDRHRAVYGTVVGVDGWIATRASFIPEYPSCRMPDGQIVAARIVGIDKLLDLALLKVNATGLTPVRWSRNETLRPGTLVMTMGIDAKPVACGIVSVNCHEDPVVFEDGSLVTGSFPEAFEHDMSLKMNQYGGPVIDLDGLAIGITIANAGTHGCLSLPAKDVLRSIDRLREL